MRSFLLLLSATLIISSTARAQTFNPVSGQAIAQNSDSIRHKSSGDPSYYILKRGQSYPINGTDQELKPTDNPTPPPIAKIVTYPTKPGTTNDSLPANAETGKCYARCIVPEHYEIIEDMVVDKPLSYKTQNIAAIYKTVTDTVITKPASVRYEEIPAVYETVMMDTMVTPATLQWVKGVADPGCLSANPADCQVLCLQPVPPVYKKVSRTIVKTPAYRREIPIAAVFKIVSKNVIDQPAHQQQIEIPATYKKLSSKQVIRKSGYGQWQEILCPDKLTPGKVLAIQTALKALGYDPGPLDDLFGPDTKAALIKYQQDKNLPAGNLNIETLRSLGVE